MQHGARKALNALTGARFVAAFWVLAYHFAVEFRFASLPGKPPSTVAMPLQLVAIASQGHLAVDFFFLLSGFILAYTYISPQGTLRGTSRAFWVARIARIYPVYLLSLVLGFEPYLKVQPNTTVVVISAFAHVFMLHTWLPFTLDWNQPSWSLSVEAFFYAFFPLILPLVGRLRRRGLWLLFTGSWVTFAAMQVGLVLLTHHGMQAYSWWRGVARYNPIVSFPEFVAGMAIGLLFVHYGDEVLPYLRRLSSFAFDVLTVVVVGVAVAVLVAANHVGIRGGLVDTTASVLLPFLAAIILLLAFQRGAISAILGNPVTVWLGEISYAVYILHKPLWYLLDVTIWTRLQQIMPATIGHQPGNLALFIAYSVVVIVVAGLSYQFLERPSRRYIRTRWGKSTTGVGAAAPRAGASYASVGAERQ